MMLTRFAQLAVGTKFKLPGGSKVYVKDERYARRSAARTQPTVPFTAESAVVPEHDATVGDILNSWRHL